MSSRSSAASSSKKSSRPRNVDFESRKPRVQAPPPREEADESDSDTSSEVEETALPVIRKSESSRFSSKTQKAKSRSSRPVHRQVPEDEDEPVSSVEEDKVVSSTSFLLAASLHVSPTTVTSFADNSFVPDFHAFFYVHYQMQETIYRNEYFRRLVPHYNSLITTIYYSVLCLFQVCRSRVASNTASKPESQFARRFEREFPLESLPVASPLLGFFETLGYVSPSKYFEYVTPSLPDFSMLTQAANYLRRDVHALNRIPPIPVLIGLLNDIMTDTNVEVNGTLGTPYWTHSRTVYGLRFAEAAEYGKLLRFPAVAPVLVDVYDAPGLIQHQNALRRFGLPATPNPITSVSTFCGLSDTESWSWFRRFAQVASHEASFFANPSNMSAVSPVGTPSLLVPTISGWNPVAFAFDADDVNPYYAHHNLGFAEERLNAFQRYGTDEEFRSGSVTQFHQSYSHATNALADISQGDWFSNVADNLVAANLVIRPTLPVAKYELNFENPLRLTNQIVQEVLYKVEGQKRS